MHLNTCIMRVGYAYIRQSAECRCACSRGLSPNTTRRGVTKKTNKKYSFLQNFTWRSGSDDRRGLCTSEFVLRGGGINLGEVEIIHSTVIKRRMKVSRTSPIGTKLEQKKDLVIANSHNLLTDNFTFVRRPISRQERAIHRI